jgi:predicted dehydrogenase
LVFVGASTIAGQYLAGAVRTKGGSDVRRVVSGLADGTTSVAKTHGIARSRTDLAASAEPAVDAAQLTAAECEKPSATSLADGEPQ